MADNHKFLNSDININVACFKPQLWTTQHTHTLWICLSVCLSVCPSTLISRETDRVGGGGGEGGGRGLNMFHCNEHVLGCSQETCRCCTTLLFPPPPPPLICRPCECSVYVCVQKKFALPVGAERNILQGRGSSFRFQVFVCGGYTSHSNKKIFNNNYSISVEYTYCNWLFGMQWLNLMFIFFCIFKYIILNM